MYSILRAKRTKVKHFSEWQRYVIIDLTMDDLITQLVAQQKRAAPAELVDIASYVAAMPFAPDLLEADEALWGSFWQFDVIAPGYTLPAIELALLRATRLDGSWPEDTTVEQFLTDLRQTILHPQAGIWTLSLSSEPFVIFAAPTEQDDEQNENPKSKIANPKSITVVWYCASTGRLHAGYRVATRALHFAGAITQRQPEFTRPQLTNKDDKADWLALAVQQVDINEKSSLTARLDVAILRIRLGG